MNTNNAYQIYSALVSERSYKPKSRRECMQELATKLLNRGPPMQIRMPGTAPSDIMSPQGRKTRTDAKKKFKCTSPQGQNHPQTPRTPLMHRPTKRTTAYMQKKKFKSIVKDQPWRTHQSVATVCKRDGGYCQYNLCPGLNRKNARKRPYTSIYRCNECSVRLGKNVFLCNTVKKGKAILCHMKYHTQIAEDAAPTDVEQVENPSESVLNS